MSSVGFTSQLPSVADFMANQGAFIDTQILMVVVGAANADTVSKTIAAQATRLAGLMSKSGEISKTQSAMVGLADKIAKPEIDSVDAKNSDWTTRQQQNPVPAIGKTPNLSTWDATHPLTYSDDADAKYLKDRGLPVAVYVPAQTKTIPGKPPTVLTAPAIGTPDAYRINKETIAAYKASLKDGTADNKIINDLTTASPDLAAVSSDLESEGVSKPTKFKEIGGAVNGLIISSNGVLSSISSLRAELMAFVDKATQSVDFLTKLGDDLGKGGRREIDKLQKRLTVLDGADLSAVDPHTRAIVEDAISKLASVTPDGDAQGLLQSLPPDQKRQALDQISAFQRELEAIMGNTAPPTSAPSFQANSRMVRV